MATPLISPVVDIYVGGDWFPLPTGDGGVRQAPPIKITGGAKDEDPTASPSKCTLTLDDPGGDYDPGNPAGPWFGDLAENTPLRVRVPLLTDTVAQTVSNGWGTAVGDTWVNNTAASSGGTVAATNWTRSGTTKTHSLPAAPAVRVSDLGTVFVDSVTRCTVTLPTGALTGAAVATIVKLRALDDNNYVGVQFIFRVDESIGIGVIERIAGVDRILQSDTQVQPAASVSGGRVAWKVAALIEGQVVRAKVWSAADPEPLDWQTTCTRATVRGGTSGIISNVASGNTNTKPFAMAYSAFSVEAAPFCGEISEFNPGVADESHAAPYMDIVASGIGRRVEQGSAPLKSAMFRWFTSNQRWIREGAVEATGASGDVNTLVCVDTDAADIAVGNFGRLVDQYGQYKEDQLFTVTAITDLGATAAVDFTPDALQAIEVGDVMHTLRAAGTGEGPVAYWPCEEEREATTIASGLVGGAPLTPRVATPEFGAFDSFLGSLPILKLNNAELFADVPDYTDTNQAFTIHFLVHFPSAEEAATGTDVVQFYTNGTAEVWELQYTSGGNLTIRAVDAGTSSVLFSDNWAMGLQGTPRMVTLSLKQTGPSTVTYDLAAVRFPAQAFFRQTQTATGVTTLGKINRIRINPEGGYVDVGFGQLAVMPAALPYFNVYDLPMGMLGENAARRFLRLGYEEDVPITYCQGPAGSASALLGAQQEATLLDNWQAAAEVDLGRFYESRGAYSFEYRARTSLEKQDPVLALDYEGGAVLAEFVPTRDDQATRNDITVKREGGSTARAMLETGPKSVAEVGRYTDAPTINAYSDLDLPDQASWRLHLGTVAEDRYPLIRITPANGGVTLARFFSVGVGSCITVSNLAARRRFDTVSQLAAGYTITLDPYVPVLELNCIPESPYRVAVLDDDDTRLDSDSTVTSEALDETETVISIVSTDGVTDWINTTDDAAEFPVPIMIGGERMALTACTSPSGATLAQDMTVTRSVNGVVKSHASGAEVHLADPVYLPL